MSRIITQGSCINRYYVLQVYSARLYCACTAGVQCQTILFVYCRCTQLDYILGVQSQTILFMYCRVQVYRAGLCCLVLQVYIARLYSWCTKLDNIVHVLQVYRAGLYCLCTASVQSWIILFSTAGVHSQIIFLVYKAV